jgi:hypothetical protein
VLTKRALAGIVCLANCFPAWAVDPDVMLHDRARQAGVAPMCAALLSRKTETLLAKAQYQKSLCLLYGVQTTKEVETAVDILRSLAIRSMAEAQLALADTLQQGTVLQKQEALDWYARVSIAGDVRATFRHARLKQRLQALANAGNAAASDASDPSGDWGVDPATLPGYHCHFYGLGEKVCHAGVD